MIQSQNVMSSCEVCGELSSSNDRFGHVEADSSLRIVRNPMAATPITPNRPEDLQRAHWMVLKVSVFSSRVTTPGLHASLCELWQHRRLESPGGHDDRAGRQ